MPRQCRVDLREFLPTLWAHVQQDSVDFFDEGLGFRPVSAHAAVDRSLFNHSWVPLSPTKLQNQRRIPLNPLATHWSKCSKGNARGGLGGLGGFLFASFFRARVRPTEDSTEPARPRGRATPLDPPNPLDPLPFVSRGARRAGFCNLIGPESARSTIDREEHPSTSRYDCGVG